MNCSRQAARGTHWISGLVAKVFRCQARGHGFDPSRDVCFSYGGEKEGVGGERRRKERKLRSCSYHVPRHLFVDAKKRRCALCKHKHKKVKAVLAVCNIVPQLVTLAAAFYVGGRKR